MGRKRKTTLADETPKTHLIQERILHTASHLMQDVGYQRMTLGRISDLSGISSAEIRRIFKSKDDILAGITEKVMERTQEILEEELRPSEILLKDDAREMLALYQYIVPLAIDLEAVDHSAMLCSIFKTMYTPPSLFEILVDRHASYAHLTFARKFTLQECYERVLLVRASMSGYILSHEFKYLFARENLKKLCLTQALRIFDVPQDKIELLLVELKTQKDKMLEVSRRIFAEL
ncbi:TetR/AcrR family transcriptional regulator [Acidaminococcus timonensis]|uniref:TetR/AcrR family transcriptional regulator n=1 Tax=Acidaminococcus timonensis TaxID=1871002 RepID=UPI002943A852|nr:TetR/AcrR family transcriptional regulator [Acidaminococcus timonensis]